MNKTEKLAWDNIAFLTLSPLAALLGGIFYTRHFGIHPAEITLFVTLFFATGLSITGGYHRHFAHISYKAHPLVKLFYLVFGACAMENSALNWTADHRMHHRYVDTALDPYEAGKGFWSSHIGWIFYQTPKDRDFTIVGDLVRDPLVRWQHRHHLAIALIVGLGLPLAVGLAIHRPIGALLWGGLIRIVLVQHMTFFINSLAHIAGAQPYSRADTSRDSWWLALLTNGEGYHNFHHRFPSDYRNGIRWYHWDPTKWLIAGLRSIGLTNKLHRVPEHLIAKARLEVELLEAERRLQNVPVEVSSTLRERMESARQGVEKALTEWARSRAQYRELKQSAPGGSSLAHWKTQFAEVESHLDEARRRWRNFIQSLDQVPSTSL